MRLPGVFHNEKKTIRAAAFFSASIVTTLFAQGEWKCATPNARFSTRTSHQAVVFDDKLWVLNGYGAEGAEKVTRFDNWYSSNGADWIKAPNDPPYPIHSRFVALVNDGSIWILGGHAGC